MRTDFIPATDEGLLAFATPFSAKITATPTAFGLLASDATALAGFVSVYSTKLALARDPATRGASTVFAKKTARANLVREIRALARQIQGAQTVTNQQRQDLGLTVKAQPSPILAPGESPNIDFVTVDGRIVKIKLHDGTGSRRAKPAGVQGASIFTYVGATPPANIEQWVFQGSTTRTTVEVAFPIGLAPGATVWLTAFWYNPRGMAGAACTPVAYTFGAAGVTTIPSGHMSIAA